MIQLGVAYKMNAHLLTDMTCAMDDDGGIRFDFPCILAT